MTCQHGPVTGHILRARQPVILAVERWNVYGRFTTRAWGAPDLPSRCLASAAWRVPKISARELAVEVPVASVVAVVASVLFAVRSHAVLDPVAHGVRPKHPWVSTGRPTLRPTLICRNVDDLAARGRRGRSRRRWRVGCRGDRRCCRRRVAGHRERRPHRDRWHVEIFIKKIAGDN